MWAGTRSAVARGLLLLPAVSVEGGSEGVEQGGGEVGGRGLVTGERFGGGGGSGEGTVEQGGWTESVRDKCNYCDNPGREHCRGHGHGCCEVKLWGGSKVVYDCCRCDDTMNTVDRINRGLSKRPVGP